jgi:diketogulonate reductase-like aldo/keto reductase
MSDPIRTTRRELLGLAPALGLTALLPGRVLGQTQIPSRPIPGSAERLPVIGLGSSKPVAQIATEGTEPLERVLETLVAHGGRVVDTWPRNADNDAAFGRVINEPAFKDKLFVTTKIDQVGKQAGLAQFRQSQRLYRKQTLDLAQIFSLTDLDVHWPTLQELKAAGDARYIGVTVAQYGLYDRLERFLERESPDFVQMNYSVTERRAEQRLLPLAAERGVAVIINRPFMNGSYFDRLAGRPLPDWAARFDCETWAQFSLKYILPHPSVTCVLTETTNPAHMAENLMAPLGRMPDEAMRARMREFIDQV